MSIYLEYFQRASISKLRLLRILAEAIQYLSSFFYYFTQKRLLGVTIPESHPEAFSLSLRLAYINPCRVEAFFFTMRVYGPILCG